MANRNQNYETGRGRDEHRGNADRWRDEEDERRYGGGYERDYGSYADTDEGDSSVRAGSYDQGRGRYGRDTGEQSGSTGRYAGYGDFGQGDYSGGRGGYSGQDRYGQSGGTQGPYRGGNYGGGMSPGRGEPNYGGSRSFSGYGYEGSGWRGSNYGGGASSSGYGSSGYGAGYGSGSSYGAGYGSSNFGGQRDQGRERDYGNFQSSGQGWNEPYGEGQQYTSRGQYAGQSMGEHRGKGPKGYQRSDDRIKEMICERLREDPHIDPSDVTINVQGGKVTLEGTVDSRQTKNAIEDVAEQFGVQEVQNNLRVQRVTQTGESGGRSATGKTGADDNEKGAKNRH
jgi:osmotically-inducible protein OsmY